MNDHYGGFWRRFLAFFIDQVILYTIYFVFFLVGIMSYMFGQLTRGDAFTPGSSPPDMDSWFMFLYWGMLVVINALYFTFFVALKGQTPGKMVTGVKVVPAANRMMTFGIAFLRWVGYIVSSIFFYLGFLWIAFDSRKQGWHDKIAGTVVVLADKGAASP